MKRRRDRLADPSPPLCDPRSAHIIGARRFQRAHTFANVILRIDRVRIHPDDDVSGRRRNRRVQSRRYDAPRIIDHADVWRIRRVSPQHLASAVVAHAVGHQHFHLAARIDLLRQNRIQKLADVPLLVTARNDDGYFHIARGPSLRIRPA